MKEKINKLIALGETKSVIDILLEIAQNFTKQKLKDFLIISSNYNHLASQFRLGLLDFNTFNLERNKINAAIIDFMFDLELQQTNSSYKYERFTDKINWVKLEKIGNWELNHDNSVIKGRGIHNYLLSNETYGIDTFTIRTTLSFIGFEEYNDRLLDNGNAGIVIGWQDNLANPRYYNFLFTGKQLILELVGGEREDAYRDFKHIGLGRNLVIKKNEKYEFVIRVSKKTIDIFLNDDFFYSIETPINIEGKVGLRPWRTKIICSNFEIN